MTEQRWKLTAIVLAAAFASLLAYALLGKRFGANGGQDAVVLQVQKLSQLVTVRYRVQRVVGLKEQKQPVGEESILLMVEGDVQGGVDLRRVTASDVTTDETGSLTITLPAPVILQAAIDESKTQVWDRHVTWWTPWLAPDPNLEHRARLNAIDDVRKAALDMGILEQARSNAQSALRDLFGALGWKVTVKTHGLD